MGSLFKSFLTSTNTQAGEVTINLNLNLTLKVEQDGSVRIVGAETASVPKADDGWTDGPTQLELPDLTGDTKLIQFGKKV